MFFQGKFVLEQKCGIKVAILYLDDIQNDCGCDSSFCGFKNIIAGFADGLHTACQKFDVQSMEYSFN